jgi:NADPH:quinone reductase-like Zn-dependent oxidoreductase
MLSKAELPETMRAAQGKDYGPIDEMISVEDGVKVPHLCDLPDKKRAKFMVLKIHAVSLAPGDCRVISGLTRELQGPPCFPYIPGGDCCGIVVELPENVEELNIPFRVGDQVAARFAGEGYFA